MREVLSNNLYAILYFTVIALGGVESELSRLAVPEPIPAPIPEDEPYLRVWSPKKMAALDELIHADTLAGKFRLPKGYVLKDGAVWHAGTKLPKVWSVQNAGCIEMAPGPRDFRRRSYFVPLDVAERYEQLFED